MKLVAAALAVVTCCHHAVAASRADGATAPVPPVPSDKPWQNTSLPVAERVASLVAEMTLQEKALQLQTSAPGIARLDLPAYAYWSEAAHGVAWAGRATVFPCSLAMAASFDAPLMRDVGRAIGIEGRAKYNDALKASGGNSTPSLYGLTFFAPNINLVRDVRWGRGQETYGEDPVLTATLGVQMIAGMQSDYGGYPLVAATSKHWFAYNLESNFAMGGNDPQYRLRFDARVSETDLVQTYLHAFDATVNPRGESPAASIMCSYNSVNGIPACGHPYMASHLRGRAGFEGFVVSDCGAVGWMGPSKHNYTQDDMHSAALFTNAGGDVCCGEEYASPAVLAVHAGLLNESAMDVALSRALSVRFRLGTFDPPSMVPSSNLSVAVDVDTATHRALARRAAAESLVLLRNQPAGATAGTANAGGAHTSGANAGGANAGGQGAAGDGAASPPAPVLPLSAAAGVKRVAVVGPNANRTMSLVSNYPGCKMGPGKPLIPECTLVNPLEGIRAAAAARGVEVDFVQGCDVDTQDKSGFAAAVAAASAADAVVFLGGLVTCQETGDQCQEAEAFDRVNVTLPGVQSELLQAVAAAAPATVLVVESGSTVAVPFAAQHVPAVLQMFYPGEEGGAALADVLFGAVNPSGRLPETVVTGLEQLPADYLSLTMTDPPGRTHRYLTATPLYAFGFGLSYSRRAYSGLALSRAVLNVTAGGAAAATRVTAAVECTAGPAGDEVVQLYTALRTPAEPTTHGGRRSIPLRELKAFTRVAVAAAGADSAVAVAFDLTADDLALVDNDGVQRAIPGVYDVWVGGVGPGPQGVFVAAAEVDAPLHATFTVVA